MTDNYAKIVQNNLNALYANLPKTLAKNLPGEQDDDRFILMPLVKPAALDPPGLPLAMKRPLPCWVF